MDTKKQSLTIKSFVVKDYQAAEKVLAYLNVQSTVAERMYMRVQLAKQRLVKNKELISEIT